MRSAQGGDVWQQAQLDDLMLTLWPMYKKCTHELQEAASSVNYEVTPFAEHGQKPSKKAVEKADLVRRCFSQLNPTPSNDEKDFRGTLYHLAHIMLMGVGMQEIIWNEPQRGPFGWERRPRATAYVHPRHFTYTQDGFLTVFDENYARYLFKPDQNAIYAPDPDRFICGQYYSHMGSPLATGLMRPLGILFSIYIFTREWMTNDAQKHGSPFMDLTYKPGTPDGELQQMKQFLINAATQGFVMHLEGTEVTVHPATGQKDRDNPQRYLNEEADRNCQLVVLGQTLTTDLPRDGTGSYAASQTHANKESDRVKALAEWIGCNPLNQWARAIIRVNYGDEDEIPFVKPDFREHLTPEQKSTLIQAIGTCPIPLLADEVYRLLDFTVPEEGEQVLITGKLGSCGPTDDEISAIGLQGVEEIDQQLEMQEQQAKIAKKYAPAKPKPVKSSELRRLLANASEEDIADLRQLIIKAKEAPHANGELAAVEVKINHIREKARFNYEH